MRGFLLLVLLSVLMGSVAQATETTAAVVTGAEMLYVRRGPGVSFPAFATIERGERVEVEKLDGVWALVRLASGQSGYVHSTFLSFPGETRATIIVPATATPTSTRGPEPSATSGEQPTLGPTVPPPPQDDEGHTMRDDAASRAQAESTAAPEVTHSLATLRSDVQRLTVAVDMLQRRLGDGSSAVDATTDHSWRSASVGVLVILALVVGWVGGIAYGRQSERSRRGRIRF
jgi:uncharacterized protein YraI